MEENIAQRIDHTTIAAIGMAISIFADAVHTDNKRLIFDSTRGKQSPPMRRAFFRPVGDKNRQVVRHANITCPNREAQIVADKRTNLPALQFNGEMGIACTVYFILARHTKKMAFVVFEKLPIWPGP